MLTVQPAAGGAATMTYNGDFMRRKREDASSTAKYVWDGAQVLLDTDAGDATVARYTLAPFGYGDLVSQRRSNASAFYHFDSLGSTGALTDASEAITDTYLYDAWGVAKASSGSTANAHRYVGRLGYAQDAALAGYYLRRRYYLPAAGRFVSRDANSRDWYAYALNAPLGSVDPSGLQAGCTGAADPSARNAVRSACYLFWSQRGRRCAYTCASARTVNCMRTWCSSPNYRCVDPSDKWCCPVPPRPKDEEWCTYLYCNQNHPDPNGQMTWCPFSFSETSRCATPWWRVNMVYHELLHICGCCDEERAKAVAGCLADCLETVYAPQAR